MEAAISLAQWATGTIEGIAFVEVLILCAVVWLTWEIRKMGIRLDEHEKETDSRFHEGSRKFAVIAERIKSIMDDIHEIKERMK